MGLGLGKRWVAGVVSAALLTAVVAASGGTGAGAAGAAKFQDGKWKLFFSATLRCLPMQGQLGLAGTGNLEVLKGNVTGTFEASGPGQCQIDAPEVTITYQGSYAWQKGALSGLATEPQLSATTHFDGTNTVSSPAGGGSQSESTDNGPVTGKLVIHDANAKTVFGELEVGPDGIISSNFFATRNCSARGNTPPLFAHHLTNGTPDNPTRVNIVADPGIAAVPQLKAALDAAIDNWNNMFEAAGKSIVFGTTPGNGPTVYVGIDNDAFRSSVASQTGTPLMGPLPKTRAGQGDQLGDGPGTSFQYGVVRLGPETPTKTWADYAQTNADNVVGIFTHELGHVVGLSHDSTDKDSLMYPDNQSTRPPTAGCSDLRALAQL